MKTLPTLWVLAYSVSNAPDAHFNYSSLFSDAQVEKVGNPNKKCEN
jgi:hypothetical protein